MEEYRANNAINDDQYEDLMEEEAPRQDDEVADKPFARPSHKKDKDKKSAVQTGFVLLNSPQINWELFKQQLQQNWGLELTGQEKNNSAVFSVGEAMVAVSLMPAPVPGGEAEANARNNLFWPEGEEVAKGHTAHILLAVMGMPNPLQQALLFVKVAASLLQQPNAVALYDAPTVHSPQEYIDIAQKSLKDNLLPLPLLVYVGLYHSKEGGVGGYTQGLAAFGKEELEILKGPDDASQVYGFLLSIADYVLSQDVQLSPGETIGFTEEQKCAISKSPGVAVEGDSLKIEFV